MNATKLTTKMDTVGKADLVNQMTILQVAARDETEVINDEVEDLRNRHVVLPRELAKQVPKSHLMSEDEWRRLGVQQSLGWVHYMIHEPEPHILLFRRPLPKQK
uniref:Cyclin-dependent kinases regulatory subunit n=1 Tax=Electrophorus electricus TaxID=8005 RepID=A0A4W4E2E0_ELEEL